MRRGTSEGHALGAEQVASYLAKYATKATDGIDASSLAQSPHLERLRNLALLAGSREGLDLRYRGIARWANMLGFRGHFATKSRRFSTTFTALREERRRYRTAEACDETNPKHLDADTTLIVDGAWTFDGVGWLNEADAALVAEAAAEKLRRAQTRSRGGAS